MLRNLGRQGAGVDLPDARENLHAGRQARRRYVSWSCTPTPMAWTPVQQLEARAARARGCTRPAAQGQTVMGTLRELRLQRARGLIEQSPRLHVGALAWRCGFGDPSDFSKLFRTRFRLTTGGHERGWGR